jgi:hypothetical protein
MQNPSTIALIAAEISHMKSTIREAEAVGGAKGRAAIGPLGSIDDYIARQRDLEELLSYYRPQTSTDAAILVAHLLERAAIIHNDYAAPAGWDCAAAEVDRLATALAGWHGAPETSPTVDAGLLIPALAHDLEKAWDLADSAGAALRDKWSGPDLQRIKDAAMRAQIMAHVIESGIAAARVVSGEGAALAGGLLAAMADAGDDRAAMLATSLAAYSGAAGVPAAESIRRRYSGRDRAGVAGSSLPAKDGLAAVH